MLGKLTTFIILFTFASYYSFKNKKIESICLICPQQKTELEETMKIK